MAAAAKIKEQDSYEWKGVNRRGKHTSGELRANSVHEAKALLRQQGITPSTVKRKAKSLFGGDAPITPKDVAILTRQIATMLAAGVPLVQSIDLISTGSEKKVAAHPDAKSID